MGKLLKAKDVAELIGVTPRTIFNYVKAGKLRPVQITPRTVRYRLEDIEALATASASKAEPGAR
jgi:predicted site-specific integrase-resolvase